MHAQWTLLGVIFILALIPVASPLPDVNKYFSNLKDVVFGNAKTEEVICSEISRDHKKRQTPEIGDESNLHYKIKTSSLPMYSNGTINQRENPFVSGPFARMMDDAMCSDMLSNYYSATRDQDFNNNPDYNACYITREIAKFYANRTVYNPANGRYDIYDCTRPDEFHPRVNNSAYTMVLASLTIHWGRYFACICRRDERQEVPDEWVQKALHMNLPFDNDKRQHFQPQGYNPEDEVSQTDTIKLGYPLNWNMSLDIQRNDRMLYDRITNWGPADLTWSFGLETKAMSYFQQSYKNYLIQPFKVWSEFNERNIEDQERGCDNFLQGLGGYVQSLIYGFAGIHIGPEMLEVHRPQPPPGASRITLRGLQYLGSRMTIVIELKYRVTIQMHTVGSFPMILHVNDAAMNDEDMPAGAFRQIDNAESGFYLYSAVQESCEHPRDYVYMPCGYSHWVDAVSSHSSRDLDKP